MFYTNVPLTRYNFPIVYGPKTVFYDPPNDTDRKLVVLNRISLCIFDMTEELQSTFKGLVFKPSIGGGSGIMNNE